LLSYFLAMAGAFQSFAEVNRTVGALAYSPNGEYLVAAGTEMSRDVWSGEMTVFSTAPFSKNSVPSDTGVADLAWVDDTTFASASDDGQVLLMSASELKVLDHVPAHTKSCTRVVVDKPGSAELMASCGADRRCVVYNLKTQDEVLVAVHSEAVTDAAFFGESSVATSSLDGTVKIWDSRTSDSKFREAVGRLWFPTGVKSLALVGEKLVVATDGALTSYDPRSLGDSLATLPSASPLTVRAAGDATVLLHELNPNLTFVEMGATSFKRKKRAFPDSTELPTAALTAFSLSPDGHVAIAGKGDVSLWRLD